MLQRVGILVSLALAAVVLSPTRTDAYGAARFGYTHVSPYGAYHVGGVGAAGYGRYGYGVAGYGGVTRYGGGYGAGYVAPRYGTVGAAAVNVGVYTDIYNHIYSPSNYNGYNYLR